MIFQVFFLAQVLSIHVFWHDRYQRYVHLDEDSHDTLDSLINLH